ncbi:MAG: DUF3078 domain-containing protein [Paludibacteraceae bacterium]|nr:DUF3078 domain-containing protein [Paludibacteraceae bacterium]
MKKIIICLLAMAGSIALFAQDAPAEEKKEWQWSGVVGLNASATGMVNWAAGGVNNVTGVAFGKVRLLYDKPDYSWETNLDVEYGMSYLDQKYDKFQKSSDHLVFNTKFGWAFKPQWYLTVQAGFQTQFDLGRKYTGSNAPNEIISNILAPSYTDISVGIDWKPNSIFSIYLSPVAGRITTAYTSNKVQDRFADYLRDVELAADPTADVSAIADYNLREALQEKYGTWKYDDSETGYHKKYKNYKASLGLTLKGSVNYTYKDLKIMSTVTLFTPYAWDKTKLYQVTGTDVAGAAYDGIHNGSQVDKLIADGYAITADYIGYRDNNQRFGNFDVDWTVAISYQFLKCLNVTLSTDLKYYNGVKIANKDGENPTERVQFKSVLGIGVGYSF